MSKLIVITVSVIAEDNALGEDVEMTVHAGADSNIKAFSEAFDVEMKCHEVYLISETPLPNGE